MKEINAASKACCSRSSKLGFRTQHRNRCGSPRCCHCSSKDPQHHSRTGSCCCTRRKSGQLDGKRTKRSISITARPWIHLRVDFERTPPALQVPTLYGAPTSKRGSPIKMAALMLYEAMLPELDSPCLGSPLPHRALSKISPPWPHRVSSFPETYHSHIMPPAYL